MLPLRLRRRALLFSLLEERRLPTEGERCDEGEGEGLEERDVLYRCPLPLLLLGRSRRLRAKNLGESICDVEGERPRRVELLDLRMPLSRLRSVLSSSQAPGVLCLRVRESSCC